MLGLLHWRWANIRTGNLHHPLQQFTCVWVCVCTSTPAEGGGGLICITGVSRCFTHRIFSTSSRTSFLGPHPAEIFISVKIIQTVKIIFSYLFQFYNEDIIWLFDIRWRMKYKYEDFGKLFLKLYELAVAQPIKGNIVCFLRLLWCKIKF